MEQFNYDPNGNILSLSRKNQDDFIDNFQYNYKTADNVPSSIRNTSNRLYSLYESCSTCIYPPYNDISPLTSAPPPLIVDYKYDISGNLLEDFNSEINDIEWTADGKIKKILKPTATILFYYDAAGNRTCKVNVRKSVEYYLRDANGELLEILEFDIADPNNPGDLPLAWVATAGGVVTHPPPPAFNKEKKNEKGGSKDAVKGEQLLSENSLAWDFYGNTSDLVSLNDPLDSNPFLSTITTNFGNLSYRSNQWFVYGSESHGRFATIRSDEHHRGYSFTLDDEEASSEARYLGTKFYELKDHLGNVRVVLKDWKLNPGNDGIPPFTAKPEEVFNYYAFGMLIPGFFSNSSPDYRFGFNGMLRDDDLRDKNATISAEEGRGNSYSTEFRGYDPRRGQWLSIDPLASKFPWSSPYVAMGNNPIFFVDPYGDSVRRGPDGTFRADGIVVEANKPSVWERWLDKITNNFENKAKSLRDWYNNDVNVPKLLYDKPKEMYNTYQTLKDPAFWIQTGVILNNMDSEQYEELAIDVTADLITDIITNAPLIMGGAMYMAGANSTKLLLNNADNLALSVKKGACFVSGTMILTSNGLKAIENISTKDSVWTYNVETKVTELNSVSNIFKRSSFEFVRVWYGGDSVTCTDEHPFFENDGWKEAKDLRQGDSLFTFSGFKVAIDSIYTFRSDTVIAVYNLEVAGNSNYYVSIGRVLVHNKAMQIGKIRYMSQWGWQGSKAWKNIVKTIKNGGTIENIGGKIPTETEALILLEDAGINMNKIRIDPAHLAPNPHTYPHINYPLPNGRGTIRINGK